MEAEREGAGDGTGIGWDCDVGGIAAVWVGVGWCGTSGQVGGWRRRPHLGFAAVPSIEQDRSRCGRKALRRPPAPTSCVTWWRKTSTRSSAFNGTVSARLRNAWRLLTQHASRRGGGGRACSDLAAPGREQVVQVSAGDRPTGIRCLSPAGASSDPGLHDQARPGNPAAQPTGAGIGASALSPPPRPRNLQPATSPAAPTAPSATIAPILKEPHL